MPRRHAGLPASILALRLVPGYEYYCRGELQLALRFVRREVLGEADNGAAWELLGLVLRDTGRPLQAADALERASLLHCIQPLSRICLAECYAVLKRRELASELYLLQAEQLADDAEMLLLVASGLDGIDKPHQSLEICRRAAFIEPQSGQIPYDMCYYSMRCGCSASIAKTLAWRAVELEPESVQFRIGLASLLLLLEERSHAAWVIDRIGKEQLEQLTCRCCLERIAQLYKEIDNEISHRTCRDRLRAIDSAGSELQSKVEWR